MNKNLKNVLLFIGIPIFFLIAVMSVNYLSKSTAETKYYEIVDMVKNNEISEYQLNLYSGELIYPKSTKRTREPIRLLNTITNRADKPHGL